MAGGIVLEDGLQLPLSKKRLYAILGLYNSPVVIKEVGGYDTGVYFSFRGEIKNGSLPADRHCGGRVVRESGFCSESIQITRWERFTPSRTAGIESFLQRVATRKAILQRWLEEYSSVG